MKALLLLTLLTLASGCSPVPRDPGSTLDRIRHSGTLRIGIVSDTGRSPELAAREFIARLARHTRSRPELTRGSAERLLPAIETGELEIVIGNFAPDSPWSTRVTFLPAPEQRNLDDGHTGPAAAVRNGENGWVAVVYEHAFALTKVSNR